jgi:hypothetical protein
MAPCACVQQCVDLRAPFDFGYVVVQLSARHVPYINVMCRHTLVRSSADSHIATNAILATNTIVGITTTSWRRRGEQDLASPPHPRPPASSAQRLGAMVTLPLFQASQATRSS